MSKCEFRTERAWSARGPLPKKIISGLSIREEGLIAFNFAIVIDGLQIAFFVHDIESIGVVFDMVDKENAVEMVDFVEKDAGELAFGFDADFGAVFELGFDFGLMRAGNHTIDSRNRETAFVIFFDFTFGLDDFGVNQGSKGGVVFIIHVVPNDNNALILANLRGGHGGRELKGVRFFPIEG